MNKKVESQEVMCHSCHSQLNFSALIFGNKCHKCNQTVCKECLKYEIGPFSYSIYEVERVCSKCEKLLRRKIEGVISVVSGHIGGHKVLKEIKQLVSPENFGTKSEAVDWLKFSSVNLGGNAVINTNIERYRNGDCITYKSAGTAVEIKKNTGSLRKSRSPNIVDELERLSNLRKGGALTEDEFRKAKTKIIEA